MGQQDNGEAAGRRHARTGVLAMPDAAALARHLAAAAATLELGGESPPVRARVMAVGHLYMAQLTAEALDRSVAQSPVPAGAVLAARKALERGDFQEALGAVRRMLPLVASNEPDQGGN